VLHDDERHAILVAQVINDNDVRMLKNSRLRLALKALKHLRLSRITLCQRFDGDKPADALVFRAVDDTHPTAAQYARDFVLANFLYFCRIHGNSPEAGSGSHRKSQRRRNSPKAT
jgi:hypothetical protein